MYDQRRRGTLSNVQDNHELLQRRCTAEGRWRGRKERNERTLPQRSPGSDRRVPGPTKGDRHREEKKLRHPAVRIRGRSKRRSPGSLFIKPGHGVWENVLPRGDNSLVGRQIPLWPTTGGLARKNGNEFWQAGLDLKCVRGDTSFLRYSRPVRRASLGPTSVWMVPRDLSN